MVTISAFCYNEGRVYVDGELVGKTNAQDLVRYRTEHPRLLAVECRTTNNNVDGGLLVSLSNGLVTDEQWRYEVSPETGWYQLTTGWYHQTTESSHWSNPYIIGSNSDTPGDREYRQGFDQDAAWIWGREVNDNPIYFRSILGE